MCSDQRSPSASARRQDNARNLLAGGLLALQWFKPLAWWAHGRLRTDQELACDAAVLPDSEDADLPRYAQALLKSHGALAAPALASGWALRHPLPERVRLLLDVSCQQAQSSWVHQQLRVEIAPWQRGQYSETM
ncbi:M56 family metallopeptidase [Paucibacter soli]|uniref:M56 family metallopeptidase n=1 Tax=Paucibacter soli TaxID=3133433 RepID=UPI0030A4CCA5